MKFRDKSTGAIYQPTDEVAAMMAKNPNLEQVQEQKAAKKPAKPAKGKE